MNHKKAVALTCLVAIIWSLAGLNIKMIALAPLSIAGGRSLVASFLLLPLILGGRIEINWKVMGGALCYVAFNYCFIISTKYTTSATAIMMQYTAPIYVALFSFFLLGEKIGKSDIFSMMFVFVGMLFFFMDSIGQGTLFGNIVAVFNGITFAGISLFLSLQKDENPVLSMFFGNVISAIIGIPFIICTKLTDVNSLFFLLVAGVLVALSYALYARASTGLTALETVLIPIIDPVMNPVWVFLFMREAPGLLSWLGAAIVLVSVTTSVLIGFRRARRCIALSQQATQNVHQRFPDRLQ